MNKVPPPLSAKDEARENGAALFVSLVFLLILTVIGLAGMQSTSLQEKMASHMRERNLAFQAAESALRAGEAYLAANVPTIVCDSATDGIYDNSSPGSTTDCPASKGWPSSAQSTHAYGPDNENFWKNNTDVKTLGLGETSHQYDKLADKPKYIIEALAAGAVGAGVSLEAGIPIPSGPKYYKITAHGVGTDINAAVVTQSVVRQ